jgi:hypothetical protein
MQLFIGPYAECKQPLGNLLSITKTRRQTRAVSALMFFSLNEFSEMDDGYVSDEQGRFVNSLQESQRQAIKDWWMCGGIEGFACPVAEFEEVYGSGEYSFRGYA